MKTPLQLLLVASALLASGAVAFAAGEYQTTRDSKTKVWNWTPKSGETVSWSGDRDSDGFGSGFGDLSLYEADGKVSAVYYGNMSRGRFEGPVNLHNGNRTLHAYFAAGDRVSGWSRGRAPSNMPVPEEAARRRAEAEKHREADEKIAEKKPAVPAPSPVIKKAKPLTETVAKTEPSASSSERSPRGPESYHKSTQTSEKPPAVAEEKGSALEMPTPPPLHDMPKTESTAPSNPASTFAEPTALPKSTLEQSVTESTPSATVEPSESESRPTPTTNLPEVASHQPEKTDDSIAAPPVLHTSPSESAAAKTPEVSDRTPGVSENSPPPNEPTESAAVASKETPADVSVNALTGPPSALRAGASAESSEKSEASPPTRHEGPLTESEVISLVEREARTHGAPIDKYDPPKVDHSAVKGKWTLFYARKADAGPELAPGFTATVDDKTQQVQVQIRK